MRSKLPIITIGWYKLATFDLIRHAERRDTFPSRGRHFSIPAGFFADFFRFDIAARRAGHAAAPTKPRRQIFPVPSQSGDFSCKSVERMYNESKGSDSHENRHLR